jgi:hypothetical protein
MSGYDMESAQVAAEHALLRMAITNALIRASCDDEEVLSINVTARQLASGEVQIDVELCGVAGFGVGGYSL